MIYTVQIADRALQDMAEIYEYISTQLFAPEAAMRQYDRIAAAIGALRENPHRCRVFAMDLRQLIIDHYSAFYLIDEAAQTVSVVRVLYSASDLAARLWE